MVHGYRLTKLFVQHHCYSTSDISHIAACHFHGPGCTRRAQSTAEGWPYKRPAQVRLHILDYFFPFSSSKV